jgi:hypothetical protein
VRKANLKEITMSTRNEFGAFAVGLLIGGLAAGAAALLYAPQSGEETRTLIKDKSVELRDRAEAITADARARADEFARQFRLPKQPEGEPVGAAETPDGNPTAV